MQLLDLWVDLEDGLIWFKTVLLFSLIANYKILLFSTPI